MLLPGGNLLTTLPSLCYNAPEHRQEEETVCPIPP